MVAEVETAKELRPQAGPQEDFLATPADVAVYGGAAGGGKTFAMLLECTRHLHVKGFAAVIFRRTYPEITCQGGIWDESFNIFPSLGGVAHKGDLLWRFPSGAVVKFAHMQYESDREKWQGSQIGLIGFDELTHFTRAQFWYMFSRNRTTCGVRPYMRATTNPDPDHWARDLIRWWIDEETGLAIASRQGVIRYMARDGDAIAWADDPETLERRGLAPKSFTFISAKLSDNKKLTDADPQYESNLKTLPSFDRERLLRGNWNVRPVAGGYFQKRWFKVIEAAPAPVDAYGNPLYRDVRYWDRAATEPSETNPDPDWTVGVLTRKLSDTGRFIILNVERFRGRPFAVKAAIKNTATQDGANVTHWLEGDPGSAGVSEIDHLIAALAGHSVRSVNATKSKEVRARPASSQAENGNIDVVRAPWNDEFFDELEAFPVGKHDDQVDALSGSVNCLASGSEVRAKCL